MNSVPESLLEKLDYWANIQPNKTVHTFVNDKLEEIETLTYSSLRRLAINLAQNLSLNFGLNSGDRVLLVYPPSLDFIVAFYACLYAGLIAVPVFPPDPNRLKKDIVLFSCVAASSSATVALTSRQYDFATKIATIKSLFGGLIKWPENLRWIVADASTITDTIPDNFSPSQIDPSSIAFLQYTSGSTSEPKGVMISHSNLSHNLSIIISALHASTSTINVSWLPQYHDMGLIGSYLGAVYCGGSGVYMSPFSFIKNPVLWLDMISRYHGTHMQAPNFAYALVTRKFLLSPKQGLDLSSAIHFINAAEPVDVETIDRFYQVFCPYGLRRGVIFPTYGLAEHTVLVACGDMNQGDGFTRLVVDKNVLNNDGKVKIVDKHMLWTYSQDETGKGSRNEGTQIAIMVGCGLPQLGDKVDVRIVDRDRCIALGEDSVGEIWVRSPSRSDGYWQIDHDDFHGVIRGLQDGIDEAAGGCMCASATGQVSPMRNMEYLKTGDLGFIHNGELFICGRIKDMMIIGGLNHYPQDVERTVEECPDIKAGSVAAFGISSSFLSKSQQEVEGHFSEVLAIMAEVRNMDKLHQIAVEVKASVAMSHGVSCSVLLLVKQGTIQKTTSGKITRKWCLRAMQGLLKGDKDGLVQPSNVLMLDVNQLTASSGSDQTVTQLDPKQLSIDDILSIIIRELKKSFLRQDPSSKADKDSIPVNTPVRLLGLDSMSGLELVGKLERCFRVPKIDENFLLAEATTILMLAEYIQAGGGEVNCCKTVPNTRPSPVLVDLCKLSDGQLNKQLNRRMSLDSRIAVEMPSNRNHFDRMPMEKLTLLEDFVISFLTGVIFGAPYLILAFLVSCFVFLNWKIALSLIGSIVVISEVSIIFCIKWPPAPHNSSKLTIWIMRAALKYFSYKVIVDTKTGWLTSAFDNCNESDGIKESKVAESNVPVIYVASPHGVFPFGHILHITVSKLLFGFDFHGMGADALFHVPILGHFMRFMGLKSVSKPSMMSLLCKGRSLGLIPGGISEIFESLDPLSAHDPTEVFLLRTRKGFVKVAIEAAMKLYRETNQPAIVRLVPCIQFGNSIAMNTLTSSQVPLLHFLSRLLRTGLTVYWGRWFLPIPKRIPILGIVGDPVDIVVNDANYKFEQELMEEYHDRFVKEMERLFHTHKRSYGWEKVKLLIK